jgi:hypothetical protein
MATTKFITIDEYKAMGLDLHCVLSYVDMKELRKKFKKELLKKKVVKVCVWLYEDDQFKNIQNTDVPYEYAVCCRHTDDGSFEDRFGMSSTRHPLGDVFIVVK